MQIAKQAIERARGSVDEDQLDRAYVEYLRASEITINIIPHHHDYRDTVHQRPDWYKQFADLMMVFLFLSFLDYVAAVNASKHYQVLQSVDTDTDWSAI